MYIAGYKNSVANAGNGDFRRHVFSLRVAIEQQLTILIKQPKHGLSDESIASLSINLCHEHFESLYRLTELEFPAWLNEIESTVSESIVDSHTKYSSVPLNGKSGLTDIFDEHLEQLGNYKYLIWRIVMARTALKMSHSFLGIDGENLEPVKIKRAIKFLPEFKQSGVSLLSYFSEIIETKYPDINATISIEQSGSFVTLIIDLPDGSRELIEHELNEYGLVISGNKEPESYMNNSFQAMMLRNKLELAQLEVRQTRDLLYSERKHYDSRIESLEEQVVFLKTTFSKQQSELSLSAKCLRDIAEIETKAVTTALERIAELVESGTFLENRELVVSELESIRVESSTVVDKINELIIRGSISGAAGNFLYACIQALSKSF